MRERFMGMFSTLRRNIYILPLIYSYTCTQASTLTIRYIITVLFNIVEWTLLNDCINPPLWMVIWFSQLVFLLSPNFTFAFEQHPCGSLGFTENKVFYCNKKNGTGLFCVLSSFLLLQPYWVRICININVFQVYTLMFSNKWKVTGQLLY